MTTVASRTIRSTPYRDAIETWEFIVTLLTRESPSAKAELHRVSGIAASVIADMALKDAPLVVSGNGPRTRIYCLHDDDSFDGSDASEDALGFDPLKGDWAISLPCDKEDLSWVQAALAKQSSRITARDKATTVAADAKQADSLQLSVDPKSFLAS